MATTKGALSETSPRLTPRLRTLLAGILSDRTRTCFGRRGPFLIGVLLVAAVGFIGLGTANTIVQIAASWFALQFALNVTQGPLTAVLPDRVPTEGRSLFSTILGLGIGTSLKHFAAHSQATERLCIDMCPSPREIELRAFEPVVREAKPWTVMCA